MGVYPIWYDMIGPRSLVHKFIFTFCLSKMVLADLGRRLNAALSSLNRAPVVDEKV